MDENLFQTKSTALNSSDSVSDSDVLSNSDSTSNSEIISSLNIASKSEISAKSDLISSSNITSNSDIVSNSTVSSNSGSVPDSEIPLKTVSASESGSERTTAPKHNRKETDIRFGCSRCFRRLRVPAERRGTQVLCPYCFIELTVPEQNESDKPSVPIYKVDAVPRDVRELQDRYNWYTFTCPLCRARIAVEESQINTEIACPDCGETHRVPESVRKEGKMTRWQPKETVLPPPILNTDGSDIDSVKENIYGLKSTQNSDSESSSRSLIDEFGRSVDAQDNRPKFESKVKNNRFSVYCPLCETLYYADISQIGQKIHCDECGRDFPVYPPLELQDKPERTSEPVVYEGGSVYEIAPALLYRPSENEGFLPDSEHFAENVPFEKESQTSPTHLTSSNPTSFNLTSSNFNSSSSNFPNQNAFNQNLTDSNLTPPCLDLSQLNLTDTKNFDAESHNLNSNDKKSKRTKTVEINSSRTNSLNAKSFDSNSTDSNSTDSISTDEKFASTNANAQTAEKPKRIPPKKELIPVVCSLCGTLMYAEKKDVGKKKKCPDCYTETLIKDIPSSIIPAFETLFSVSHSEQNSTFDDAKNQCEENQNGKNQCPSKQDIASNNVSNQRSFFSPQTYAIQNDILPVLRTNTSSNPNAGTYSLSDADLPSGSFSNSSSNPNSNSNPNSSSNSSPNSSSDFSSNLNSNPNSNFRSKETGAEHPLPPQTKKNPFLDDRAYDILEEDLQNPQTSKINLDSPLYRSYKAAVLQEGTPLTSLSMGSERRPPVLGSPSAKNTDQKSELTSDQNSFTNSAQHLDQNSSSNNRQNYSSNTVKNFRQKSVSPQNTNDLHSNFSDVSSDFQARNLNGQNSTPTQNVPIAENGSNLGPGRQNNRFPNQHTQNINNNNQKNVENTKNINGNNQKNVGNAQNINGYEQAKNADYRTDEEKKEENRRFTRQKAHKTNTAQTNTANENTGKAKVSKRKNVSYKKAGSGVEYRNVNGVTYQVPGRPPRRLFTEDFLTPFYRSDFWSVWIYSFFWGIAPSFFALFLKWTMDVFGTGGGIQGAAAKIIIVCILFPAIFFLITWGSILSQSFLSLFEQTESGNNTEIDWPDESPVNRRLTFLWLFGMLWISVIPGGLSHFFFPGFIAFSLDYLSAWLFFPLIFLSTLETGRFYCLISLNIFKSLFQHSFLWLKFYGLFFLYSGGPFIALYFVWEQMNIELPVFPPFELPILLFFGLFWLIPTAPFFCARLLGRLGWKIHYFARMKELDELENSEE